MYKISKAKFYILSFTWGLPVTLAGCFFALIMLITGHKPHRYGYCVYFEVGKDWGGMSSGIFFITGRENSEYVKSHEHGHSIQNCYFGFLMPFIVCLPSSLRFWFRTIVGKLAPRKIFKPYDSVWFENQATNVGKMFIDYLSIQKNNRDSSEPRL